MTRLGHQAAHEEWLMPLQTAVHRRNRGFIFRLRVPARLVPVIGRQFLKRSLETADPLQARLRGARLLRDARRLFAVLEQRSTMLKRDEIEAMVRGFYAVRLEEWRLSRYAPMPDIDALSAIDQEDEELPGRLEEKTHDLQTGLWQSTDATLKSFAALFGLQLAPGSRDETLLREYLMRATRQLLADQIAIQRDNNYAGQVIDELFQRPLPDPAEIRARAVLRSGPAPAPSAAVPGVAIANCSDLAPVGTISGSGGPDVEEIFGRAIEIAAADGRNMRMAAAPRERVVLVPEVAQGKLIDEGLRTIPELFPEFIARKTDAERADKTLNDYKRSLAAFVEIIGLKPVALYRARDVDEFTSILRKVPARHRVIMDKTGPYRVAVAINDAKDEKNRLACMKLGTINNKYLTNLVGFFDWALKREMIAKNPARGMQLEGPKGAGLKPRRPFTIPELQMIFHSSVFTGCKSARHFMLRGNYQLFDHRRFVIPLALFTGCRLNELGQLRPNDLFEEAGRWWLRITTRPDPEDADDAEELRSLKTISAERLVPLHPTLISTFGFVSYVQSLPANSRRIFPGWEPASDGYYSTRFSKWFNERFLGKQLEIKKPDIVFHSLRHNMKDACRRAHVELSIQNRLLGHSNGNVGESYGTPSLLPEEAERIDRIAYPGLDLSRIRPYRAGDSPRP